MRRGPFGSKPRTSPRSLVSADSQEQPLETLCDQHGGGVLRALATPPVFADRRCRLRYASWSSSEEFADHFAYTPLDLRRWPPGPTSRRCRRLICTYKDLVKIGRSLARQQAAVGPGESEWKSRRGWANWNACVRPIVERATEPRSRAEVRAAHRGVNPSSLA